MTSHNDMENWFLAQCKPNSHAVAERNLIRQGFATFLPMREETMRVRNRFITRLRPLFPGYLFVALDVGAGKWRAVNSTNGISRLVSLGKAPTQVPRDLVAALMQRDDPDSAERHLPGDHVTLSHGPFADVVATIDSIAPDRRVWLLMDVMGAQTRVSADAGHLRAI